MIVTAICADGVTYPIVKSNSYLILTWPHRAAETIKHPVTLLSLQIAIVSTLQPCRCGRFAIRRALPDHSMLPPVAGVSFVTLRLHCVPLTRSVRPPRTTAPQRSGVGVEGWFAPKVKCTPEIDGACAGGRFALQSTNASAGVGRKQLAR